MRKMCVGVLAAFLVVVVTASAQRGGAVENPIQEAMERVSRLFAKQSFSARVVMILPGVLKREPTEFTLMMSQGKMRVETDVLKIAIAADETARMPVGLGKMVMITRPDRKVMYQVIQGTTDYAEIRIPDPAAGNTNSSVKVDRKAEGNEKVEGYDCERIRNTVTAPDAKPQVMMTWEAKDLKGLPVKVEVELPEGKMTLLYKDIKITEFADSLFEPPVGYTKHGPF